jgi:hypothetical protein
MIRHYVITFDTTKQRLSSVLPGTDGGPNDLAIKAITVQPFGANAAACYIGGWEQQATFASATSFGVRLEAGAAGVPPAPFVFGEFSNSPMKLSDFVMVGANTEKAAIMVVI